MSSLKLNNQSLNMWFRDKGDYTHNITYELDDNSVVMDLGGYTGVWAQQIVDKYNPNMYILEPIPKFHTIMVDKFKDNPKVHLLNNGVSTENKKGELFLGGDGTSSNLVNGESITVDFKTIDGVLYDWGLDSVDLIQINIEGDEYPLLEYMLNNGSINKFKNIQIQFHLGIDDDVNRRIKIQEGLSRNGFKIKFNYPFVWESWTKS